MIDLKGVSWGKLLVYAVMAIVTATLSYCKASDEATSARSASRAETEASYKTLVESVRHLEMVVTAQQETLVLLVRGSGLPWPSGMRMNGSGAGSAAEPMAAAAAPAPIDFPELPDTAREALQMQTAK